MLDRPSLSAKEYSQELDLFFLSFVHKIISMKGGQNSHSRFPSVLVVAAFISEQIFLLHMDRTIAMSNTADPSTGPSPCPLAPCRAFCLIAGVTYFWEFNVCRNAERSAWKAVAPVMTVICKSPAQLKRITTSFSRSGMDPCEIQRTTRTKDRSASRDRLFFSNRAPET